MIGERFLRRLDQGPAKVKVPKAYYEYCKRISELTKTPLAQVMKSRPAQEYLNRIKEEVEIDASEIETQV